MKITYPLTQLTYQSQGYELEGLILKPEGDGPFPAIVHIHGFNFIGAWDTIYLSIDLVKAGYAVFLPSQMGFAKSQGERDYCGPKTVQGVYDGIQEFLKESFVDKDKIGVWGISRGSNVASMLISRFPKTFKVAVLQSGMYDFKNVLATTLEADMAENMRNESGNTEEAFSERSAIEFVEDVNCPVLIIHGRNDTTYNVQQAMEYVKKLTEANKEHELVTIEEAGHMLKPSTRKDFVIPYFEKYLK
jgi:dipeptidyl aminopeptidase/acylaminoacyl peptidase